jgi:ubiquinone/menaquinone biosynthesis C-methylase UbiE
MEYSEYLCVDNFLKDIFDARALATAFETGLIDRLIKGGPLSLPSLRSQDNGRQRGVDLLLGLLLGNRVIAESGDVITLTEEFRQALKFRDLLEMKATLANWAAHDFIHYFNELIYDSEKFFRDVKFLRLFSYDRCLTPGAENYEATERWMRITTTLTRYESEACLQHYDFGRHHRMVDVGGNSGEFALRVCRRHQQMQAVVFDLPLVCDAGQRHIAPETEANRISFSKGNALTDPLPLGADLVTFKSMLHDWPEKEAGRFLANAGRSLEPGGTLLIFERGPIDVSAAKPGYSLIPFLLFYHSFRSPVFYENSLGSLGFRDIVVRHVQLDTPFFIVTATKPEKP